MDLEDTLIEPLFMDGLSVPLIRLTTEEMPPRAEVRLRDQSYHYERSYPIKGYSAVMPGYLREQMATGKKPLLVERDTRYYVYFAA